MTKQTGASSSSSTSGVGAAKGSQVNLAEAIAAAKSLVGGSSAGRTWTQADSDAAVQGIFQQLLGRNAQGVEYAKALSLVNSGAGTSAGITQAVQNYVESLPEYQSRSQNKWLEAIYNDLDSKIREARA
jgi:hypothetical protein